MRNESATLLIPLELAGAGIFNAGILGELGCPP